jgi:predicted site-specific integrase-resolvase
MSTAQGFLHPRQVAIAWGVNYETILRRIASGDIRAINVAPKGSPVKRWRIPASEVNRPGMVAEVAEEPKVKRARGKR